MAGLKIGTKKPAQWPDFEGVSLRSQQSTLLSKQIYSARKSVFSSAHKR
jgi:hypothetical protein